MVSGEGVAATAVAENKHLKPLAMLEEPATANDPAQHLGNDCSPGPILGFCVASNPTSACWLGTSEAAHWSAPLLAAWLASITWPVTEEAPRYKHLQL